MSLKLYAGNCLSIKEEILETLSENDIKELQKHLISLGVRNYGSWYTKNLSTIESFLQSPPSNRLRKKAWNQEYFYNLLLKLAAVQTVESSYQFLNAVEENDIYSVCSYRDMAVLAARAYHQAFCKLRVPLYYWPFDNIFQSPFDSQFNLSK